ncbi:MAG: alanine racemase [Blautia sp.]|nr:alanine racemase [Blautia sp.]MDD7370631.1 alanine racemase [Bacillota bacterium]MDY3715668.1 alanine racemase [Blautia sp.]
MNTKNRVYATVNLDAIVKNLENMKKNIQEDTKIIAVLKADGYGHGAVPIAKHIEPLPYLWGIAVATVEEGMILRKNGITKPILILGYTFSDDYDTIIEQEMRPAVFTLKMARELSKAAVRLKKPAKIHIKIDTGMSRIGYRNLEQAVPEILEISALDGIEIEGIFTHFARADETDPAPAYQQMETFEQFIHALEEKGLSISVKHCSNSAGILRMKEANMNVVRAGIILYGLYPSDEVEKDLVPLEPAMELKSHIVYIKTLEPGVAVSYGGTYVTSRPTRVATIPVGYADGYCRGLSNKGFVLIHGKKAPILGRICMDQFMVDVTDIPEAQEADEVTLLGRDQKEQITMEELGNLSGRFNYEFACCISRRVPRIYR